MPQVQQWTCQRIDSSRMESAQRFGKAAVKSFWRVLMAGCSMLFEILFFWRPETQLQQESGIIMNAMHDSQEQPAVREDRKNGSSR